MSTTLPRVSVSGKDRDLLQHFVRLVDGMSRCRFIEAYRSSSQSISCNEEGGVSAPGYDWEDFRAFMTDFRQIAVAAREPVRLKNICKLVESYASAALKADLVANWV